MLNINMEIARRTSEIYQDDKMYLNYEASLKMACREFEKGGKENENIEGIINKIVHRGK